MSVRCVLGTSAFAALVGAGLTGACASTPGPTLKAAGTGGAAQGNAGYGSGLGGLGGLGGAGGGSDTAGTAGAGLAGKAGGSGGGGGEAGHDGGASSTDGGAGGRAAGCGMAAPLLPTPAPLNNYVEFHVTTTGATPAGPQPANAGSRSYWVRVPADYDPSRSYRTVFQTGLCIQSAGQPTVLPLFNAMAGGSDEAIYVVIDAPASGSALRCYDTSKGPQSSDFEAFALVHDAVAARYCIDEERVFVVSRGQSVSDQLGCYFGGRANPARAFGSSLHVRGQLLLDGEGEPAMQPPCDGPVAALWLDDMGALPPHASSGGSLTRVRAQDTCTGTTMSPWGMGLYPGCQQADGCRAGYPVVLCSIVFGRTDQASLAVKMFETFMEQASPSSAP